MKKQINLLREFSVPLIAGVAIALVWANAAPESYTGFMHKQVFGSMDLGFIANEIFMVFFFGIAAVEITISCLPNGSMNPFGKAINTILSTMGGVAGPILVYLVLNHVIGSPALSGGWGVPTATDIALAWVVSRLIFGNNSPVIFFLLLLAIADDAIGIVIIALFYPDPRHPVAPYWLVLTGLGMLSAFLLRKNRVTNYWPYLAIGGALSWTGLFKAHLHPALALVCIVPFMPHAEHNFKGMFEEDPFDLSTLSLFEHEWKVIVDFGLFLFGLANAGVQFSGIRTLTWLVFLSLVIGKSLGIFMMGLLGEKLGFPLPSGMTKKHLLIAGVIAGIGFTVALFMSGAAFSDPSLQAAAKMGAMLSITCAVIAVALARLLRIKRHI